MANEVTNSNLHIINNGHFTHQNTHANSFSAIDISIVSLDLANKVNWSVSDDNIGSDHLPILCEIGERDVGNSIRNITKLDMDKLTEIIPNLNFNNAETLLDFEQILEDSITECTNKIVTKIKYTPKPWWTKKNQDLWTIKRNKQRIYFKYKTPYTALELKRSIALIKKEIRLQKENTWNNFIEELNPNHNLKTIYKK